MKKYIIVTGICSSLIFSMFLTSFQISFQQEYIYEVSSGDGDIEVHGEEVDIEIM